MENEIQIVVPVGMFGASDADSMLDKMLREIAVAACDPDGEWFPMGTPERNAAKYGVRFENEVFFMSPDYMDIECDCGRDELLTAWHEANPHAEDCYDTLRAERFNLWESAHPDAEHSQESEACDNIMRGLCDEKNIPWDDGRGCMCHCSCGQQQRFNEWFADNPHKERCPVALPNFWFKPTDLRVEWYKYIGRDVEINRRLELAELVTIHEQCIASLKA